MHVLPADDDVKVDAFEHARWSRAQREACGHHLGDLERHGRRPKDISHPMIDRLPLLRIMPEPRNTFGSPGEMCREWSGEPDARGRIERVASITLARSAAPI